MKHSKLHMNERHQAPLGKLLREARETKYWSRKELASKARIAENSIARYEKAGIEADGQFPPAPKLAILCHILEISPVDALNASIPTERYMRYEAEMYFDHKITSNPRYRYLEARYEQAIKDNLFLKDVLKLACENAFSDEKMNWMLRDLESVVDRYSAFERRMLQYGFLRVSMNEFWSDAAGGWENGVADPRNSDSISDTPVSRLTTDVIYEGWKKLRSALTEIEQHIDIKEETAFEAEIKANWADGTDDINQTTIAIKEASLEESPETGLAASPSSQDDK